MNLVAKEYVAAQNPVDPGVLILSRFAGAAAELTAALLVNPYDPETVATSISCALSMPLNNGIACLEPPDPAAPSHLPSARTGLKWCDHLRGTGASGWVRVEEPSEHAA
jgi:Glycosyltransferase family 20